MTFSRSLSISRSVFAITLGAAAMIATDAAAQPSRSIDIQLGPSGYIVQEERGNRTLRYRLDDQNRLNERHPNARFVLPDQEQFDGGYFVEDGNYFYLPEAPRNRRGRPVDPRRVEYGGFSHIGDLALRYETLANDLALDLYYNYSHNRGYRQTYAEAYHILQLARFIRDAEQRRRRDEILVRLPGLDKKLHHLQEDLSRWTRRQNRQIGEGDAFTKMAKIEAIIHHLMYDAGIAPDPGHLPRRGGPPHGGRPHGPGLGTAPPPR